MEELLNIVTGRTTVAVPSQDVALRVVVIDKWTRGHVGHEAVRSGLKHDLTPQFALTFVSINDMTDIPAADAALCTGGADPIDAAMVSIVNKALRNFTGPVYAFGDVLGDDVNLLAGFDHMFLRSPTAYARAVEAFSDKNVTKTTDPSVSLKTSPARRIYNGRRIAFAVPSRPRHESFVSAMAALVEDITRGRQNVVYFMAFRPEDVELAHTIAKAARTNNVVTMEDRYLQRPESMIKFLSNVDCVVTAYYHCALFALVQNVPLVIMREGSACESLIELGARWTDTENLVNVAEVLKMTEETGALNVELTFAFDDFRKFVKASKRKAVVFRRSPPPSIDACMQLATAAPPDVSKAVLLNAITDHINNDFLNTDDQTPQQIYDSFISMLKNTKRTLPRLEVDRKIVISLTTHDEYDAVGSQSRRVYEVVNALLPLEKTVLGKTEGLLVDPYVERTFANKEVLTRARKLPRGPWVGFSWHNTLEDCDLSECKALLTFSEWHRKQLLNYNVPVFVLPWPTPELAQFHANEFKNNPKKRIVHVGGHLRRDASLFQVLADDYTRTIVTKNMSTSIRIEGDPFAVSVFNTLKSVYDLSEYVALSELPSLLTKNVVFLDIEPCSMATIVHVCVASKTPIVLRKQPAFVELLGDGYPGFFTTLFEASQILNNVSTIIACSNALREIRAPTASDFVDAFQNVVLRIR